MCERPIRVQMGNHTLVVRATMQVNIYSSLFTITVVEYNIKNTLTNKLNYTVRNNSAEVLNFVTLFCPVFWHAWGVPSPSVTYCHSWRVRGWAPQLLEVIGCERFRCNPWMDNTSGVKPWTLYVNLQEHLSMDASSMAKNGTSRCYRWGVTPFNASQLSVQIITLQPFIKTHFGHKFYFNPANRNWYTINEVWT